MTRLDLRPLDIEPVSIRGPFDVHRSVVWDVTAPHDYLMVLHQPLVGIRLGAYDEHMITWPAGWDVAPVTSLLHRARAARPIAGAR